MAETETFVFRASLRPKIHRDFEIAGTSSLYALAQAIVSFFDFDFDHAFGFYSKLKGNIYDAPVRYELFVDMGEAEGEARSVKRTRIGEAFPLVGTKLRFLFDYGDEWIFLVELVGRNRRSRRSGFRDCWARLGGHPPSIPIPKISSMRLSVAGLSDPP
jgi:hypothetical protein